MSTTPMSATPITPTVRIGPLMAVIVLAGFMAGLDTSLVNVGLSTIARNLHTPLSSVQWVTSGYLLALAVALPAGPWLQRRFGSSRLWLVALIAFTLASLLCAISPNLPVLIVARILQGGSGGLLVPTGQNIIGRVIDVKHLGRMMSTAGLAIVAAPAFGPALGGLLIDGLGWRFLFVVNLPLGIIAVLFALRVLPKDTRDPRAKLDLLGLLLLSTGLPLLSYGITQLASGGPSSTLGIVLSAVGVVLLAAFVFDAVRPGRSPNRATLIEVGLFRRAPYATAQITVFFTGLSLFGGLILLPLYYEKLRGIPVIQTGLLLLAYGAGAMIALIVGGRLTDRFGSGITCIIGLLITIGATLPFVFLPQNVSLLNVEVLQGLRGLGIGMAGIPAMTATMRAAGGHMADATTTANILQRVGGSLGSAIIVIVIARSTPDIVGFQAAHGILVITAVLALVASASLAISERRHAQSMASTPTQ